MASSQHYYYGQPSTSSKTNRPLEIAMSSLSSSSLQYSTSLQTSPLQTSINALHYSMLINNEFDELIQQLGESSDLKHLLNDENSTMLHLAASTSQTNFIDCILRVSPSLLRHPNLKGDLAIHVAAKTCQYEAVQKLVFWAYYCRQEGDSEMLEMVNGEKNTALHIALENQYKDMAEFLFNVCSKTFCFVNEQGFCPLYLAIKAEFWFLVEKMIGVIRAEGNEEAEENLLLGRSVIHAVIIAKRIDILKLMIEESTKLLYDKIDELGRKPLSYAACTGFLEGVNYLLTHFPNEAFKTDEDENGSFPIHSACKGGDMEVVKAFFTKKKESRLLLNKKGQNILHVAASSGKTEVVEFILGYQDLEMMINMKDEDGNTPLHLAAMKKHARVVYVLTWDKRVNLGAQNKKRCTALDVAEDVAEDYEDQVPSFEERLTWLSLRHAGILRAPKLMNYLNPEIIDPTLAQPLINNTTMTHFNEMYTTSSRNLETQPTNNPNEGNTTPTTFITPDDHKILRTLNLIKDHPKIKSKNKYKERINALIVVAALVATVTFNCAFTVPGGFNNNNPNMGLATLAHKVFFKVFVISDAISMYSAILSLVSLIWAHLDDLGLVLVSFYVALPLLCVALAMMSVAFMAALFVVLHGMVVWLGIVVLVMGGVFLVAFLVFFLPLCLPTFYIRTRILRYVFHIPFMLMLLACEKGKRG